MNGELAPEIIEDLARGDSRAGATFYDAFARKLIQYVAGYVQDPNTVEDIVQQVFLNFFQAVKRQPQFSAPRAYLYKIARHAALEWLRTETRERNKRQRAPAPVGVALEVMTSEAAPNSQRLYAALEQLPEEQRNVVMLRAFNDCTFQEIADIAATPLQTVYKRYQAGLKHLKELLA